jgi:deoxyribose-phosphate aldolase
LFGGAKEFDGGGKIEDLLEKRTIYLITQISDMWEGCSEVGWATVMVEQQRVTKQRIINNQRAKQIEEKMWGWAKTKDF